MPAGTKVGCPHGVACKHGLESPCKYTVAGPFVVAALPEVGLLLLMSGLLHICSFSLLQARLVSSLPPPFPLSHLTYAFPSPAAAFPGNLAEVAVAGACQSEVCIEQPARGDAVVLRKPDSNDGEAGAV